MSQGVLLLGLLVVMGVHGSGVLMLQAGGLDPTQVQLNTEVAQIAPLASDSPHHGSANHSACGSGDGWKFKPVTKSVVTSECP